MMVVVRPNTGCSGRAGWICVRILRLISHDCHGLSEATPAHTQVTQTVSLPLGENGRNNVYMYETDISRIL